MRKGWRCLWSGIGGIMSAENKAKITFVGELLCDNAHIRICTDEQTGEYDFKTPIQKITKYFQDSDYLVANLETPLGRRNEKFEFAEAGIDSFLTGNNHSYDQGEAGLLNTLETLDSYGVVYEATDDSSWYQI